MHFTITCTDGVILNGDTTTGQKFHIEDNGVLTFWEAPEGDKRQLVSYSPAAWTKVSYTRKASPDGRQGRAD